MAPGMHIQDYVEKAEDSSGERVRSDEEKADVERPGTQKCDNVFLVAMDPDAGQQIASKNHNFCIRVYAGSERVAVVLPGTLATFIRRGGTMQLTLTISGLGTGSREHTILVKMDLMVAERLVLR
jgi:hypothetical protein